MSNTIRFLPDKHNFSIVYILFRTFQKVQGLFMIIIVRSNVEKNAQKIEYEHIYVSL